MREPELFGRVANEKCQIDRDKCRETFFSTRRLINPAPRCPPLFARGHPVLEINCAYKHIVRARLALCSDCC